MRRQEQRGLGALEACCGRQEQRAEARLRPQPKPLGECDEASRQQLNTALRWLRRFSNGRCILRLLPAMLFGYKLPEFFFNSRRSFVDLDDVTAEQLKEHPEADASD